MKSEKHSELQPRPRRYEDACAAAHALDLVGDRWALLVMRELLLGPRRFGDLRASLPGISANVLTQRLNELEARGLVRKTRLPPPAAVQVYEATDWGLEAVPVIARLGRWAARSPLHDATLPMSHVSIVMSLQTLTSPERAKGFAARVGFRLGDADYVTTVHDGQLDVERTEPTDCDAIFIGTPTEIAGVIHGGAPFETIKVEGDLDLARRFAGLFVLPDKVEATPALA